MSAQVDDEAVLVDSLDRWFAILRKRLNEKIPLKPVRPSQLDQLANVLEVDLPPDVVTLFEYTNGAWANDERELDVRFLPDYFRFMALPNTREEWDKFKLRSSFARHTLVDALETDDGFSDYAYGDFPGTEWAYDIPLFEAIDGEISVQAGELYFQACAAFHIGGMHWVARRLSGLFENAIALEQRGMIAPVRVGSFEGPWGFQRAGAMPIGAPWDPDRAFRDDGTFRYPGWAWEDVPVPHKNNEPSFLWLD